ncbi:pseudouridine synthase [Clostridium sp. BJN0001]|uniref:pseudouridine synthase n=1 Tax=Clostridium sp. BJN0001 TaxID=2930219 RepID=UPI001FD57B67|nr:pseudouridine synthase [Clostridium sp. BJN0001]
MRINKLFSNYGICSRKETNKLIEEGRVTVDGEKCSLGQWVTEKSVIELDKKRIKKKEGIYLAFNKPKGIICTSDHDVKNNIIDYINYNQYIFSVGRLDKDSEGLILMTNDGDFSDRIINGLSHFEKEYVVRVDKKIDDDFIENIKNGVVLSKRGKTKINRLTDKMGFVEIVDKGSKIKIEDTFENLKKIISKDEIVKTDQCKASKISDYEFRIILKQGLNRQIRRMCKKFSYNVTFLKRIRIDKIHLDGLETGKLRKLNKNEFRGD